MDDINVFLGFGKESHVSVKSAWAGGFESIEVGLPDKDALIALANEYGHNLSFKPLCSDIFIDSLKSEGTWTFFIGHSVRGKNSLQRVGIQLNDFNLGGPYSSKNEFVGIFGCSSSDYACYLANGAGTVFSVMDSGQGKRQTKGISLTLAAFAVIESIMKGNSNFRTAEIGTKTLGQLGIKEDKGDKVVY